MIKFTNYVMSAYPNDFPDYNETYNHLYKFEDDIKKHVNSNDDASYSTILIKLMMNFR